MRLAAVALGVLVAVTPLQAAASRSSAHTFRDYGTRILAAPSSGDELSFRRVFHDDAQQLSNRLFAALQKVLGGDAPTLNFVDRIAGGGDTADLSATPTANRINVDPAAVTALIDENDGFHSSTVNQIPHEMAHLRQTPQVLANTTDREGGAQGFADLVSPVAAALAKTHYIAGNFDGSYAPLVKAVLAQHGRDWLLGPQFGHAPVSWP